MKNRLLKIDTLKGYKEENDFKEKILISEKIDEYKKENQLQVLNERKLKNPKRWN